MKVLARHVFEVGRWDATLTLEAKMADAWVGAYVDPGRDPDGDRTLDLWVCLVPFLPIHVRVEAWAERKPWIGTQEAVSRLRGRWDAWWAPMDWSGPLTAGWREPPIVTLGRIGRNIQEAFGAVFAWFETPGAKKVIDLATRIQGINAEGVALGMPQETIDSVLREAVERAQTSILPARAVIDAVWDREKMAWHEAQVRAVLNARPRTLP